MEIKEIENKSMIVKFENTNNVLDDVCNIIESAKQYAYQSINVALVQRNWLIGYRIEEEELKGKERADYGKNTIVKLSKELTKIYGKGFTKTNLYNYYSFYKMFPNIFHPTSGKSQYLLSWTHYRVLLQVFDEKARNWYEKEAKEEMWSVRTLQQNINYICLHKKSYELKLKIKKQYLIYNIRKRQKMK